MKDAVNETQAGAAPMAPRIRLLVVLLGMLLLAPAGICSPPRTNFSGTWRQSNDRCVPKRTGDVVRRIDHNDPGLIIETTVTRHSEPPRHVVQRYSTDGRQSISTGADGDEFHTSVVRDGQSLVFSIEEHEDGRVIRSKEVWTLLENGSVLQVDRETFASSAGETRRQTLIYVRQTP